MIYGVPKEFEWLLLWIRRCYPSYQPQEGENEDNGVSCKILPAKTQNAGTWELDPGDRIKVFEGLVAANHRGEIYDYDVSSIITAL